MKKILLSTMAAALRASVVFLILCQYVPTNMVAESQLLKDTGTSMLQALPENYGLISHALRDDILYYSFSGSDVLWRTDGTECGPFEISVGVRKADNPIPVSHNLLLFSGIITFMAKHLPSAKPNI